MLGATTIYHHHYLPAIRAEVHAVLPNIFPEVQSRILSCVQKILTNNTQKKEAKNMAPPHSVSPTSSTVAESCCHDKHNSRDETTTTVYHPLEPLTKEEIQTAGIIVKEQYGDDVRFEMIVLQEPQKKLVRAGEHIPRSALVSIYGGDIAGVTVLTVNLETERISNTECYETAHPMISLEEFVLIEDTVKACPEFIAACKKRGITDMDSICVDPWSAGGDFGHPDEVGRHISHTFAWIKTSEHDNLYAHPLDGVNAVVDLSLMKVIRVDDHGVIPVPQENCNYDRDFIESTRTDLKPINIEQPEGVSFKTTGRTIHWHEWSMVIGFNAREALTFHDVSYAGRPVVFRASLAEMVVPYGSPRAPHYRKNVFDIGEYGIGKLANSLTLGWYVPICLQCSSISLDWSTVIVLEPFNTWMDGSMIRMAIQCALRMRYAFMRKIPESNGSTGISARSERRFVEVVVWSSRPCQPLAIMSTEATGTFISMARWNSR